jgi:ABC-type transport system involved in multi-copper enzyme maturation permease subunit
MLRRLRGLSPFGPIFGKELRVAARRRRNYLLRVLYLVGLLLFLFLAYEITASEHNSGGLAARTQAQEQLGWCFFMFFSMFCVIAMALIGPVVTSTAINQERQAKTFHVLLMTPMTAWQIVSGKLFSRLLTPLTLIGLSMPVLALVRLLGGVELEQMFGVVALCIVTAMMAAAIGLFCSILLRRAYAVILLSYFIMGVVYVFIPVMTIALLAPRGGMGKMPLFMFLGTYNPFWSTGMLASGQFMRMFPVNWYWCVIGHLIATALLLFLSSLLVRRLARREGEVGTTTGAGVVVPPPPQPLIEPLIPPDPSAPPLPSSRIVERIERTRKKNRTVSDHPILWRELRRPLLARNWQKGAGVIIALVLFAISYFAGWANDAIQHRDTHIAFAFVFHLLLIVLTAVLSATAIAQEKEGDTWTVLLASPLSGAAIVWGKAAGVASRLFWPLLLFSAHFLVFALFGVIPWSVAFITIWVMLSFNAVWLATGIFLSLHFRKVTVAVIVNLALPLAAYGAAALVMQVIDAWLEMSGSFVSQIQWWLPWYYLLEAIDKIRVLGTGADLALPGSYYGTTQERVMPGTFLFVTFVVGLIHVAVAAAILWITSSRLNAAVGRAPQVERLADDRDRYHTPSWVSFPAA